MSETPTFTFMVNTSVKLLWTTTYGHTHAQNKVPIQQSQMNAIFLRDSICEYPRFISFGCLVLSVTRHDRCQHLFVSILEGFSP